MGLKSVLQVEPDTKKEVVKQLKKAVYQAAVALASFLLAKHVFHRPKKKEGDQ